MPPTAAMASAQPTIINIRRVVDALILAARMRRRGDAPPSRRPYYYHYYCASESAPSVPPCARTSSTCCRVVGLAQTRVGLFRHARPPCLAAMRVRLAAICASALPPSARPPCRHARPPCRHLRVRLAAMRVSLCIHTRSNFQTRQGPPFRPAAP
jgi:hypothetical protein